MNEIVRTKYGLVRGQVSNARGYMAQDNLMGNGMHNNTGYGGNAIVYVWKGIPYGKAERFAYPEPPDSYEGILDALEFGPCSYQPRAFADEAKDPDKAFYHHEFREGRTYTYADDCLNLNIWAPKDAKNLPVLFYIHGGGFLTGSSSEIPFEGDKWCQRNVVVVTINYRLGPFGLACFSEIMKREGHCGNYSLYDQLQALQWVRENINAFGGDANRITLMGQSAGAISVQQLCSSPLTEKMFVGAIMLSFGGVTRLLDIAKHSAKDQYSFWQKVMERTGAESVEMLQKMDAKKLMAAFQEVSKEEKHTAMILMPIQDGRILTESNVTGAKAAHERRIPYITCSTSEDMLAPILYRMGKNWGKLQREHGNKKCYRCFFKRQLPGDDRGAWHSSDLWYVFGMLEKSWRPFKAEDEVLSNQMIDYYSNFVKTGNPNGKELPIWRSTAEEKKRVMVFDVDAVGMDTVNARKLWKHML